MKRLSPTHSGIAAGARLFSRTMEEPAGEMAFDSFGDKASNMAAAANLDPPLLQSDMSS